MVSKRSPFSGHVVSPEPAPRPPTNPGLWEDRLPEKQDFLLLFRLRNTQAQPCLPVDLLCEENTPLKLALCCSQLNSFLRFKYLLCTWSVLATLLRPSPITGRIH